jgi:hypothetical protein
MPPSPTAPCSLAGLLAVFRACFTAPTFQTFVGLVVGLIAQTRRRTVCGMLTGAGPTVKNWYHAGLVGGQRYNDKGEVLYQPPGPNPPTPHHGLQLTNR